MKVSGLLLLLTFGVSAAIAQKYPCLPADVKQDSIVGPASAASASMTVREKLKTLKARCSRGKLVDRSGRKIRFYQLQGCWGNPPADYAEILEAQTAEIRDLKKKYTVIELACNAEGQDIRKIS